MNVNSCLVIIAIVGEETYKIYSKKVFNKEVEIDTGSDAFIEEMSESIKDAAKEIDSDLVLDNIVTENSLKSRIYIPSDTYRMIDDSFCSSEPMKAPIVRNEG